MHPGAMIIDQSRTRRIFACLGDPSRFRLVSTLIASEFCVTDLARQVGLSQSCTTRHLQALQREGLVAGIRQGKRVMFRVRTDEPMIAGLVAWALSHPGQADPSDRWRVEQAQEPRGGGKAALGEPSALEPQPAAVRDLPTRDRISDSPSRRDEIEDFLL